MSELKYLNIFIMEQEATISQLIDFVTSTDIETPDINVQIEIASRMVDNVKDMVVGLRDIDKIMTKGKIKRKYFALLLIEVISKNSDLKVHEQLTKKKFLESFMTLLKQKRGKKGLLVRKEKGLDKHYKEKAEIKALYLIQLWSDTFMMHQDNFPGVHEWYKTLRKEGVEFPPRDPNERLMMENLKGIDSPMFDFIEQTSGKEKPKSLEEIKHDKQAIEDQKAIDIIENDDNEQLQAFGEKEDFRKFWKPNYDRTEFEVAKSTIMILEDMCNNAEHINDLRTEVVKDIYVTCKISRIRIAKIVEVRSFANMIDDLEELLEVLDFLDKKLDAFKIKYTKLKNKEEARRTKQEVREKEEAEKKQKEDEEAKQKSKQKLKEAPTTAKPESSSDDSESEESEYDEFDEYNKDDQEAQDIGNIDLLDLGLGESPQKQFQDQEKVKEKKPKKHKKDKKKKDKKKSKKNKEVVEDKKVSYDDDKENVDAEEVKPIKKLIAPPSGARKIQAPVQAEAKVENNNNNEEAPKVVKPDLMDLLEF